MNIIEQLGGYEQALDLFKGCPWDSGTVDVPDPRSKGMLGLDLNVLGYELLEYRHQHNIFEVGDKVVGLTSETDEIFEIETTSNKLNRRGEKTYAVTFVGKEGLLVGLQYRHATPEEIKAGKRLEIVNESE